MIIQKIGLFLCVGLLAAGCAGPVSPESPAGAKLKPTYELPNNYRQLVINFMRENLKDPYSLRDVQISSPRLHQTALGTTLWSVCTLANGKNSYGGYTGLKPTLIVFGDAEVSAATEEYAVIPCSGATYAPFVEYVAQMRSG